MREVVDFLAGSSIDRFGPLVDECKRPIRIDDGDTDRTGFDDSFDEIPLLLEFFFVLFVLGNILDCAPERGNLTTLNGWGSLDTESADLAARSLNSYFNV